MATRSLKEIRQDMELITLQREILKKQMEGMDVFSAEFMQYHMKRCELKEQGHKLALEELRAIHEENKDLWDYDRNA